MNMLIGLGAEPFIPGREGGVDDTDPMQRQWLAALRGEMQEEDRTHGIRDPACCLRAFIAMVLDDVSSMETVHMVGLATLILPSIFSGLLLVIDLGVLKPAVCVSGR